MTRPNLRVLFSEYAGWLDYCGYGCISYWVELSWRHAACSYGQPVVLIQGVPHGPGDLWYGELQVPPELLEEVRSVGFAAQPLSLEEMTELWEAAPRLPLEGDKRLVQY